MSSGVFSGYVDSELSQALSKRLAKRIIKTMNMRAGQTLLVKGGSHEQALLEDIMLEAEKAGIDSMLGMSSDRFYKNIYDAVSERFLKRSSKLGMKIAGTLDNYIGIERLKDPRIAEAIPHAKTSAAIQGGRKVSDLMDKRNVKWVYVGYPSRELASKLHVPFATLKKFIWSGILVDESRIVKRSRAIHSGLRGARAVRLKDEYGTNLELRIAGRRLNVDDGFISNEDISKKDVGCNLPAGEVFLAPQEMYGSGVLVSPKRTDKFTGKMIENIRLVFEHGRLNMQKTTAEKNEKALKETLKRSIELDKKAYKVVRTTNVAELGIGLNPIIDKIVGYLLTDEKIGGTIHVALGKNIMYGGKSDSTLHWDFISNIGVTLEAIYPNGKSRVLIEKGKVVGL